MQIKFQAVYSIVFFIFALGFLLSCAAVSKSCGAEVGVPSDTIQSKADLTTKLNSIIEEDGAVTYTTRQLVASIPWGEGPGQLPYHPSDMGGLEDAVPSELLSLTADIYWLRDTNSGRLFIVNVAARSSSAVDVAAALPEPWHGVIVYTYGMARMHDNTVSIVVGGRPAGGEDFVYALARFDGSGHPKDSIPLAELAFVDDSPQDLAVASDGTIWVLGSDRAYLFSADGKFLKTIEHAQGVMLPSDVFISNGSPPQLLDSLGTPLGKLSLGPNRTSDEFVASGPQNFTIALINNEALANNLDERLQAFRISQITDSERTLAFHDLILTPTLRLKQASEHDLGDGMPIQSHFPQEGITFTDAGDIVMLELTDVDCRFYVLRKLPASKSWHHKFTHPVDLSKTEMEVLQAEYLTRLGKQSEDGPFWQLFQGMRWLGERPAELDSRYGTSQDLILRELGVENATRP